MEPVIKETRAGRQLGNAAAAAAIAGIHWETYQWYVRTQRPNGNPAPKHIEIDNDTGQRMYSMKAVQEWHNRRPGRGNWGGCGAQARKTPAELAADAYKARRKAQRAKDPQTEHKHTCPELAVTGQVCPACQDHQTEDKVGGEPVAAESAAASV